MTTEGDTMRDQMFTTDHEHEAYELGVQAALAAASWVLDGNTPQEDTSEEPCTDHGFDECPDCGNGGVKIDGTGYVDCTRFLTCWTDLDDGTEG